MGKTSSTVVMSVLVGLALPAAAQECGQPMSQAASLVEGRWLLDDGPLVTLEVDGDNLSWTALAGSAVYSVSVETGETRSATAAVSAAVIVPGGPTGTVPPLVGSRTVLFHGVASCEPPAGVVTLGAEQSPEGAVGPTATAQTITPERVAAEPGRAGAGAERRPTYRSWRRHVR